MSIIVNKSMIPKVKESSKRTSYERAFFRAVGARIELFRLRRGLSLEEVAAHTVHPPEWLKGLEAGTEEPRLDDLFGIAKALGTDPGELVSVEPKMSS